MSDQPSSPRPSTTERILDLLLDALLERQAIRQARGERPGPDKAIDRPAPSAAADLGPPTPEPIPEKRPRKGRQLAPKSPARPTAVRKKPRREPRPGEEGWTLPPRLPPISLDRTLGRLLLALVVLVVLLNVPVNRHGTSLARIMPDTAALVIRDGLVLKGSGPEIYVLEDYKIRWISSLEAFEFFDYRWEQVHIVDDSFLEEFEKGRPMHVLLKCQGSPHIYALENGQKRWIKDIPTFEAEGYAWDDVKMVHCSYLRNLPDGLPIPDDAGPPPQP